MAKLAQLWIKKRIVLKFGQACVDTFAGHKYTEQRFFAFKRYNTLKIITKRVWILSAISLFTDMASEMLYPIMPVYLKSIGFSMVLIGVLEGLAEAAAGLSKGYFGQLSDQRGQRAPFVQLGYTLSALSKPMMAVLSYPWWIFVARTVDRMGKGIRTGARDAMLSDEATPATKGRIFGFHRAMDTIGAVLGPLLALLFLHFNPGQYRPLFLWAFIPGGLAVVCTFYLRDKNRAPQADASRPSWTASFGYWRKSPAAYRQLLIPLLLFALFNSSDVFLLLKMKESGIHDTAVIGLYIFYNLVYVAGSYPAGMLGDRIGLRRTLALGIFLFAAVYAGMAYAATMEHFLLLLFGYGLYAACSEGIAKAWISNLAEEGDQAAALGTFAGFQSLCALLASSLTGLIWYRFGASWAFLSTSLVALGVIGLVWRTPEKRALPPSI